ncbi:MAG: E3 binding domain-containing protein, partial [Bdellovibrionales bacterium]|nr:E3 binding domain-containing protein [Bdellovibrionales bacterium]
MATLDIKLPEIGEGVTEGELVNWLVKVGDTVKVDQPIVEIMTDKATVEIPSHTAGTVKDLKFNPGDMMAVDSVIMVLETSGAAQAAPKPEKKEAPKAAAASPQKAPTSNGHVGATGGAIQPPVASSHVLATPSTRRLARESSVDINALSGTGLAGRVTRDDVLNARGGGSNGGMEMVRPAATQTPRPAFKSNQAALEERVPMRGIRKKIAENMQLYKQIIPHFSLMDEVDVTSLVKMRESLKADAEKMGI